MDSAQRTVGTKIMREQLKDNELFRNTNISNLNFDDLKLNLLDLKPGEVLFRQGDPANSIYLVINGEINLIKKQSFGKTQSPLYRNSFFGQEEYLLSTNRNSIAIALKDSQIVELLEEDIDSILSQDRSILNNIKSSVVDLDSANINSIKNAIEELQNRSSIFPMELAAKKTNEKPASTIERLNESEQAKLMKNKVDFDKIESGINTIIKKLQENLSELENEKVKIRSTIADYEKDIEKELNEIKTLKDRELRFIRENREKNEILGQQSYRIIELEKEAVKSKNLELKHSEKIESLLNREAKDKINIQRLESALKEKDEVISKLNSELKENKNTISNLNETQSRLLQHNKDQDILIEEQKANLKNYTGKIESLTQELSNQETKNKSSIQRFESVVKEKNEIISKLDIELKENKEIISGFNETHSKLLQKNKDQDILIEELKANLKNYTDKIERLTKELSAKDQNIITLNDDLLSKNQLISEQADNLNKVNEEIEKIHNSIENKNETIDNLSVKLSDLQNQLGKQKESEKNKDEFILNQSHKIAEYEETLKNFKTTISQKDEILNNFIEEIGELSGRIWQKQTEIIEQNGVISELNTELDNLKISSSDWINKESDLKGKIVTLESQLTVVNNELNTIVKDVEEKNRLIETKGEENSKLHSRISDIQQNLNDMESTLHIKDNKINELENSVTELKNELADNSESQKLEDELHSVTTQLIFKKKAYNELNAEKNSLLNKLRNLELLVEQNKNESNNVLLKTKEDLETLTSERENYKNSIQEKDEKIEDLAKQLVNLKETKSAVIKSLTSSKATHEDEIKEKDNQITELKSKLEEIKNSLEEKTYSEEQQGFIIENQAQKIAELEILANESKLNISTEKPETKEDNKESEKEDILLTNDAADIESAETDQLEIDTAEKISFGEDDEILSKCKFIGSESVNSFMDDKSFEHLQYSDIHIVNLNLSRATMDVTTTFSKFLFEITSKNEIKLVVNLSNCEFVDSSILGVLVSGVKKARAVQGDLRIVWHDQSKYSMFYLTRMDKVFQIFHKLKDAVESYS